MTCVMFQLWLLCSLNALIYYCFFCKTTFFFFAESFPEFLSRPSQSPIFGLLSLWQVQVFQLWRRSTCASLLIDSWKEQKFYIRFEDQILGLLHLASWAIICLGFHHRFGAPYCRRGRLSLEDKLGDFVELRVWFHFQIWGRSVHHLWSNGFDACYHHLIRDFP